MEMHGPRQLQRALRRPDGWWERADYERQWTEGAEWLLRGESPSAFVVEAGRVWWTAWRDGTVVFVHQRYLVTDEMAPARTADAAPLPYKLIAPASRGPPRGPASPSGA